MQQSTTSPTNTNPTKTSLMNNSSSLSNLATSLNPRSKCPCSEYNTKLNSANRSVQIGRSIEVDQCVCCLVCLDQGKRG